MEDNEMRGWIPLFLSALCPWKTRSLNSTHTDNENPNQPEKGSIHTDNENPNQPEQGKYVVSLVGLDKADCAAWMEAVDSSNVSVHAFSSMKHFCDARTKHAFPPADLVVMFGGYDDSVWDSSIMGQARTLWFGNAGYGALQKFPSDEKKLLLTSVWHGSGNSTLLPFQSLLINPSLCRVLYSPQPVLLDGASINGQSTSFKIRLCETEVPQLGIHDGGCFSNVACALFRQLDSLHHWDVVRHGPHSLCTFDAESFKSSTAEYRDILKNLTLHLCEIGPQKLCFDEPEPCKGGVYEEIFHGGNREVYSCKPTAAGTLVAKLKSETCFMLLGFSNRKSVDLHRRVDGTEIEIRFDITEEHVARGLRVSIEVDSFDVKDGETAPYTLTLKIPGVQERELPSGPGPGASIVSAVATPRGSAPPRNTSETLNGDSESLPRTPGSPVSAVIEEVLLSGSKSASEVFSSLPLLFKKVKHLLSEGNEPDFESPEWEDLAIGVVQLINASSPNQYPDDVIMQTLQGHCGLISKTRGDAVHVFLSSTFVDMKVERDTIHRDAVPFIRKVCDRLGLSFTLTDMRWGIRDEATDDHKTEEICLTEIAKARTESVGPWFACLLGDRYGFRPFKRNIPKAEFETLLNFAAEINKNDPGISEVQKWFKEDLNKGTYDLQPISSLLPNYLSSDMEKRKESQKTWWSSFELMSATLRGAAAASSDEQLKFDYTVSITEKEIQYSFAHGGKAPVISFLRDIQGAPASAGLVDDDTEAVQLQRSLKTRVLESGTLARDPKVLKAELYGAEEHQAYADVVCRTFAVEIVKSIAEGVLSDPVLHPVLDDVVVHTTFGLRRCETFTGRVAVLQTIASHFSSGPHSDGSGPALLNRCRTGHQRTRGSASTQALVVHGVSGAGKTSVMARAVRDVWESGSVVVQRFVGASAMSSTLRGCLHSMCLQLKSIATGNALRASDPMPPEPHVRVLVQEFHQLIREAALAIQNKTLIIVVDSLDQFRDTGGIGVGWVPRSLPANVRLVLSVLPGDTLENLQRSGNCGTFVEVPPLDIRAKEHEQILDRWLGMDNLSLTAEQRKAVIAAFEVCPLPLYLKLVYDRSKTWPSYKPPEALPADVSGMVELLFSTFERVHGPDFVSAALGCLTAACNGLSASELMDVLALDDTVLNSIFQYWTPPLRRIPPHLWTRLRADLGEYLTEGSAAGARPFRWYHRQFWEAAARRYLSGSKGRLRWTQLAEYFSGQYAQGKAVEGSVDKVLVDRKVSAQPLSFVSGGFTRYNVRKMVELPLALFHAQKWQELELLLQDESFTKAAWEAGVIQAKASKSLKELAASWEEAQETRNTWTLDISGNPTK